jgi:hypothetical protein
LGHLCFYGGAESGSTFPYRDQAGMESAGIDCGNIMGKVQIVFIEEINGQGR